MEKIIEYSSKIKQCKVSQVLPDECEHYLQPSILLTLQCAKEGASKQQINTAISRGETSIMGDPIQSPYNLIKKKIASSPYFITPETENFIAYSSKCADYKEELFRISAQAIKDGQAKFIVTPVKPATCLKKTNLDKKYPILTPQQLKSFEQGIYLEKQPSAERPYENVEVMVADSLQEAGEFFSRMKKRVRLTVNTIPKKAEVTVVGMKRPYKKGMKLNVGTYKVRVTSPTYVPLELEINLEEGHSSFDLTLESSIEKLRCQDSMKNFPLTFNNKYYLKQLDSCTYTLLDGGGNNTPFNLLIINNSHPEKNLIKLKLGVVQLAQDGNSLPISVEEIVPRLSRVNSRSSGISDVPKIIHEQHLIDNPEKRTRLVILDATFSL
ncbi:MAG: PEGA domain-containing protein [Gammaproteobacteria bacterium]|nr:PEGA domain-containing protein [Gammaproteobacteria bacterium]